MTPTHTVKYNYVITHSKSCLFTDSWLMWECFIVLFPCWCVIFFIHKAEASLSSLWGSDVKFKFLPHVWQWGLSRHEAVFLFSFFFFFLPCWSSTFIGQVGWYLIWSLSTASYQCGKAGLSVILCLGTRQPVFTRLARADGSFFDPSNSAAAAAERRMKEDRVRRRWHEDMWIGQRERGGEEMRVTIKRLNHGAVFHCRGWDFISNEMWQNHYNSNIFRRANKMSQHEILS